MNERWFLGAGLIVLVLAMPSNAAAPPPNVVLILADDLGWSDLGCCGSTFYETPAVDTLAAQGMRFDQAYPHYSNQDGRPDASVPGRGRRGLAALPGLGITAVPTLVVGNQGVDRSNGRGKAGRPAAQLVMDQDKQPSLFNVPQANESAFPAHRPRNPRRTRPPQPTSESFLR